ncbi:MAG: acyltransferase [Methanobacteriota archaeon]
MAFDRKSLVLPDKTVFDDRVIVTKGDVVIGDRSMLQFGIRTDGRIFVGEHVVIDGELDATKDVRVDIFSSIGGNIVSGGNVYLGEKVKVKGKLSLKGDLDVGDSVEIEQGFEAKGWINIRSPIPIIIYIFIYLTQLLRMGRSEEIERILDELEVNDGAMIPISETFLFIPNNSIMSTQKSRVDANLWIGKQCKILGNYTIKGNATADDHAKINGSIDATGDVVCGKHVTVHGNLSSTGETRIDEHTIIYGNVSAEKILLSKTATVQGTLFAANGISFVDKTEKQVTEKVKRFETNADIVDEVKSMLE